MVWTQMGNGIALLELRPGEKLTRAAIVHVKHVLVVSANGTKNFVVKPGDQEQVPSKKIETFILTTSVDTWKI